MSVPAEQMSENAPEAESQGQTPEGENPNPDSQSQAAGEQAGPETSQEGEAQGQGAEEETQQGTPASQQPASFENLTVGEDGIQIAQEDFDSLQQTFQEQGLDLNQETAQKLVDFEQQRMQKMMQSQQEQHQQRIRDWEQQTRTDEELGGDSFDENQVAAQEAFNALASPELKELFEQTGIGNHPEVFRLFHKLAPMVREERPGLQGQSANKGTESQEQSRLNRLYGESMS